MGERGQRHMCICGRPWSAQELRGDIYASCDVLEERADADGAFFRFRAVPAVVAKLTQLGEGKN